MSAPLDPQRLAQAAAWRIRLSESEDTPNEEFERWLAEDARNRAVWRAVQSPWEILGEHAASAGVIRLRRGALAHAHDAMRYHAQHTRRTRRFLGLAAAASILVCTLALLGWLAHRPDVYRTGFGERRVVTLADGSQIALDSRSEVTVRYTADARALTLVRGQAHFDVAHDVERPFTVTAADRKVVATGTEFNVDLPGNELLVTLIRGHVVVLPSRAASRPYLPAAPRSEAAAHEPDPRFPRDWSRIVLNPGEQLVMARGAAPRVVRVDLARVTAWEHGEIDFSDERLSQVVAQIDRYSPQRIVLGDPKIASLRISGVFRSGDVDTFVGALTSYLPIEARTSADGATIVLQSR